MSSINYAERLFLEKIQKQPRKATSFIIAGCFTAYCVINTYYRSGKRQKKGHIDIPVPKGCLPYVGHLFSLTNPFITQVSKWQKELGSAMYIFIGIQRWLIISDPHLAHELLSAHGNVTTDRSPQNATFGFYSQNRGITYTKVTRQWIELRATVLKFIGLTNRVEIKKAIERETNTLVESIMKISERDGQINIIKGPLMVAAINGILAVTAGTRLSSADDPLFKSFTAVTQEQSKLMSPFNDMSTIFPIFSILDYLFHRPAAARFLREKFHPMYNQILKKTSDGDLNCLANELRKLPHIDNKAVHVSIHELIYPGHQLVANSIAWIIAILCCYPETQKKLQTEIDEFITVHKRIPTFDDRKFLPYLTSVQKECLRYRPVSSMGIAHGISEDVVCRGYFIPKGTILATNMFSMHMDPKIYDNPEKFIPERFLQSSKSMASLAHSAVKNRDVHVFGWGRRTCLGVFLAETQVFTTMTHLLARCSIEPPIDENRILVYPDLNKFDDMGGFLSPTEAVVRIHRRECAVV